MGPGLGLLAWENLRKASSVLLLTEQPNSQCNWLRDKLQKQRLKLAQVKGQVLAGHTRGLPQAVAGSLRAQRSRAPLGVLGGLAQAHRSSPTVLHPVSAAPCQPTANARFLACFPLT